MLEERVIKNVYKHKLIRENDNIILGLSGGPDSMVLLHILLYVRERISFNLVIAHVNHGVRGEEALKDEKFTEKVAKELGLDFFSTKADMVGLAKEKNISEEEAGREIRYVFFRELIKELGHGKIAVAHNRNDQAETLLMRIMRGTGIDGLAGMSFKSDDIIRPILDINRWEIEKYVEENSIETVVDKTNLETIYSRNKVRLELIPYIKENFNPNIIDTLFRLSENAKLDSYFLEDFSSKVYKSISKEKSTSVVIKSGLFMEEDKAVKNRIIRKAIYNLINTLQGIEEVHISSVVDLFNKGETGKRIDLPNNLLAKVSYNNLIIEKNINEDMAGVCENKEETILKIGQNYLEGYNLEINLKIMDRKDINFKNVSSNVKFFDYDIMNEEIWIRTRNPGDRFAPIGMKGRKKIKDYFIDEKIPRDLRDEIPLLMCGENIIWVIGYRMSEAYKVKKETRDVLRVEYKNKLGG